MTLPAALAPLARYRQFILYRLEQRGERLEKLPVDWRTGAVHDAHDPAIWLGYDDAHSKVQPGLGVAFVLTDNDPFFFLDVDHCLEPTGQWSALAQELCGMLAGAAVEVSVSGTGLHVFGVGTIPRHTHKNVQLGLELYTTKRFVALGTGAVGNVASSRYSSFQCSRLTGA